MLTLSRWNPRATRPPSPSSADGRKVLTDQIFSQADLHAVYGGVVPEIASRSHVEVISRLADRALAAAGVKKPNVDAVAVSLCAGTHRRGARGRELRQERAAWRWACPLIPVHHIRGHIAANYLAYPGAGAAVPVPGHLRRQHAASSTCGTIPIIRHPRPTRDDAAGECFDKIRARARPALSRRRADGPARAARGVTTPTRCRTSYVGGSPYDMSFSGLKTAVINLAHNCAADAARRSTARALARARSAARVSESLVPRTMAAARVSWATKRSSSRAAWRPIPASARDFAAAAERGGCELFMPPLTLCGDNAAMIGCAGLL